MDIIDTIFDDREYWCQIFNIKNLNPATMAGFGITELRSRFPGLDYEIGFHNQGHIAPLRYLPSLMKIKNWPLIIMPRLKYYPKILG